MTKLVEKNDKVKSFSALLVENQLIPVPIRFLNQLRKAQVLQNSLRKVYLSILLSNWNCYLWESITAYNYGFAQDLPEKGKPCAKPLTVGSNFTQKNRKTNNYDIWNYKKLINSNNYDWLWNIHKKYWKCKLPKCKKVVENFSYYWNNITDSENC